MKILWRYLILKDEPWDEQKHEKYYLLFYFSQKTGQLLAGFYCLASENVCEFTQQLTELNLNNHKIFT